MKIGLLLIFWGGKLDDMICNMFLIVFVRIQVSGLFVVVVVVSGGGDQYSIIVRKMGYKTIMER